MQQDVKHIDIISAKTKSSHVMHRAWLPCSHSWNLPIQMVGAAVGQSRLGTPGSSLSSYLNMFCALRKFPFPL